MLSFLLVLELIELAKLSRNLAKSETPIPPVNSTHREIQITLINKRVVVPKFRFFERTEEIRVVVVLNIFNPFFFLF